MSAPLEPASPWRASRIVATMFPLLVLLSIVVTLGSGFVLQELQATYLSNPVLLLLVPAMIGMGGNLGAILSSRLSSRLHLGVLSFDPRNEVLQTNVAAILVLGGSIFLGLGVVAYLLGHLIGAPLGLDHVLTITLATGMGLTVAVIVLSVATTYLSYRFGVDPDDTTIPIVTNLCDVLGVVILSGVSSYVL